MSSLLSVYHHWGGEHRCRCTIYILTFVIACILSSIYSHIQCLPSLRGLYFRPESLNSSASCWILKLITYRNVVGKPCWCHVQWDVDRCSDWVLNKVPFYSWAFWGMHYPVWMTSKLCPDLCGTWKCDVGWDEKERHTKSCGMGTEGLVTFSHIQRWNSNHSPLYPSDVCSEDPRWVFGRRLYKLH